MSAPRRFDWDEAERLRSEGVRVVEIAERFGVTPNAIYLATDDECRARQSAYHADWQVRARVPCIDGCGSLVSKPHGRLKGRCRPCAAKAQATSVRDDTLQCVTCREWKPDRAFPHHRGEKQRRQRHSTCRVCHTAIKRVWREARKVPCSHGCGARVLHDTNPAKPPECRPCAMRRVNAARRSPGAVTPEAESPREEKRQSVG